MAENHHFHPKTGVSKTSKGESKAPTVIFQGQEYTTGNHVFQFRIHMVKAHKIFSHKNSNKIWRWYAAKPISANLIIKNKEIKPHQFLTMTPQYILSSSLTQKVDILQEKVTN